MKEGERSSVIAATKHRRLTANRYRNSFFASGTLSLNRASAPDFSLPPLNLHFVTVTSVFYL
jgi:hypothetical protein